MIRIGFVIDTWVWAEYFRGGDERVSEYIENEQNDLFTSTLTLTEMIKFLRRNGENPETIREIIAEIGIRSIIVPVTEIIAIIAGELEEDAFKGGIADRIILATARSGNHKVVTGDLHFRDLPDAVFIKNS